MFVDKVKVNIQAGNGGNGAVSFRQERFIDRGGPDGGNGGDGGSVVLEASRNQNTLAAFRYKKLIKAEDGQPGSKAKKHGKSGKTLIIQVPVGTVLTDSEGKQIADMTSDGQQITVAAGGKGGFGNAHFVSSVRQAPRVAEKGEKGQKYEATMELKMIADVGLVGLPNAGKSTLISVISGARPEIASYPFTTLVPNLGVVDVDNTRSLLFADIPGLIEGASKGKGLGDEFLRHIERTKVLVHLIDIYQEDLTAAYKTINKELKAYSANVAKKPQLVVLTKIEGLDQEMVSSRVQELKKSIPAKTTIMAISAQSKEGLKQMLYKVADMISKIQAQEEKVVKKVSQELPTITIKPSDDDWQVEKKRFGYLVKGVKLERFAARTDYENEHSVARLRDIMRRKGVIKELLRRGIKAGDKIYFGADKNDFLIY